MYIRYSIGFLIATFLQIAIVYFAEQFGFSSLSIRSPFLQFILQIILGQIMGYILMFALNSNIEVNRIVTGAIWGILYWGANTTINIAFESIKMPWHQANSTIMISIISCIVYGITTTYIITSSKRNVES